MEIHLGFFCDPFTQTFFNKVFWGKRNTIKPITRVNRNGNVGKYLRQAFVALWIYCLQVEEEDELVEPGVLTEVATR